MQGVRASVEKTSVVRMGVLCRIGRCVMAREIALMGPMRQGLAVSSVLLLVIRKFYVAFH